jgi:hypothetical protein
MAAVSGCCFGAKCIVSYVSDSRSIAGHRVRGGRPLRDPEQSYVDTGVYIHRTPVEDFPVGIRGVQYQMREAESQ